MMPPSAVPVEMALLQNGMVICGTEYEFGYQSKWHCSKTEW